MFQDGAHSKDWSEEQIERYLNNRKALFQKCDFNCPMFNKETFIEIERVNAGQNMVKFQDNPDQV